MGETMSDRDGRVGREKSAIVRKNIEHYQRLLEIETDEKKRTVIRGLLEEARARLSESE